MLLYLMLLLLKANKLKQSFWKLCLEVNLGVFEWFGFSNQATTGKYFPIHIQITNLLIL